MTPRQFDRLLILVGLLAALACAVAIWSRQNGYVDSRQPPRVRLEP